MDDLLLVIFFSLIGGFFSLIGGVLLLARKSTSVALTRYATPFAAGALLAAVFLDLLPEGLEVSNNHTVFVAALVGILLFFIAERFLRWFHHHHEDDKKKDPTVSLIVAGDTMHNVLDGVAIAAGFLVSVPTGIITTVAVAAHEIPQEIGDFGLLLSKGLKRGKVLLINALSALATSIAAVITYVLGSESALPVGVLLGLSAGFLLYIALSDVIPTIHAKIDASKLVQVQTVLLILGVVVVGLSVNLAHGYIDNSHTHEHESGAEVRHEEEPSHHEEAHSGHDPTHEGDEQHGSE